MCPKCGYDQSGAIATWAASCPIVGTCPECGIRFNWKDVFNPGWQDLRWYAEHGRSFPSMIARTPITLLMLLLPNRFWVRVDPTRRVAIPRLLVWAIFVFLAAHMLVAIPNTYSTWSMHNWNSISYAQYYQMHSNYAIAETVFDGLAFPYFNAEPAPASFRWSLWINSYWSGAYYTLLIRPLTLSVGIVLLWSIVMLAIPQTRRLSKLRTAHIARAAIISLLAITLQYELNMLIQILRQTGWITTPIYRSSQTMLRPAFGLWLLVFWGSAIRTGWLIHPWKLLTVLGTFSAILGGVTLSVYIFIMATA